MKTKRIKAIRKHINAGREVFACAFNDTEPCYVLRQSDVRALAEQMQKDYHNAWFDGHYDAKYPDAKLTSMLHALRRAGITPGRARKGGAK